MAAREIEPMPCNAAETFWQRKATGTLDGFIDPSVSYGLAKVRARSMLSTSAANGYCERRSVREMRALDIMTTRVAIVSPDTTVEEIVRRLIERRISAMPVVDADGKLVGMVSDGDLLRRPELGTEGLPSWASYVLDDPEQRAAHYRKIHGLEARDVMSTPVWTVEEHATLAEIAELLETRRIKRVPVVRNGRLIGLVSRANLLHGFAASKAQKPVTAADRELRTAVADSLVEHPSVPDEFINVTVADGVVHLWGMVPTQAELDAARAAVERAGAKVVENHLRVLSLQPARAAPAPEGRTAEPTGSTP
jgi:CBS domain-containing protein